MRIELIELPTDDVVAHELIDGVRHGEFFVDASGDVCYRYADHPPRHVNRNRSEFEYNVSVWHWYQTEVRRAMTEAEELTAVRELKRKLASDPDVYRDEESFWSAIVEQCEQGML